MNPSPATDIALRALLQELSLAAREFTILLAAANSVLSRELEEQRKARLQ